MGVSITVVESTDRQLTMLARGAGLIVGASVPISELAGVDRQGKPPDVLLVDLRGRTTLPTDLANLKRRHPRMLITETRAGKPRLEAFKNLASRTGVDDVRALVSMLVQTDRFGTSVAQALRTHAIVVITDGYDEHSTMKFERALEDVKEAGITVYVIGVAGVAGISLEGEDLLRHIAVESGGRAFFPFREEQLSDVHAQIASDVQIRYVLTYTPKNQKVDGTWRAITVKTDDPTHTIKVRKGYTAPLPPPIKPSIELTIRDANRQFVDVTAEDLVVLEDGVEQKVEVFQEAVAPVSIILVLDESGSMKRAAPMVMAPGSTRPPPASSLQPCTRSLPARSSSTNFGSSPKS